MRPGEAKYIGSNGAGMMAWGKKGSFEKVLKSWRNNYGLKAEQPRSMGRTTQVGSRVAWVLSQQQMNEQMNGGFHVFLQTRYAGRFNDFRADVNMPAENESGFLHEEKFALKNLKAGATNVVKTINFKGGGTIKLYYVITVTPVQ